MTRDLGGAKIYLKREDLNHTGAHKINNVLGQALLAKKMGKPCIGTYHIFTENIMANLGMRKARLLNYLVTLWWRKSVYDCCAYVHCPTETVKRHLVSNGFQSPMRVISNGIEIPANIEPALVEPKEQIIILCT